MADIQHKDLTGADLHEPKGVDAASASTVYVADGAGSGTWAKIAPGSIDTTSVLNLNQEQFFGAFIDIGTAGSRYQGWTRKNTVTKILVTLQTATAGADTLLTFRNHAGSSMGSITVPNGSVAGSVFLLSPVSNNTFLANERLQVDSDGGTSTNTNASFTFDLLWTV